MRKVSMCDISTMRTFLDLPVINVPWVALGFDQLQN